MAVLLEVADEKDSNEPDDLKVADAVWVGTALLHEQNPNASDFTTEQIVTFVAGLHLTRGTQKSIWQHVNQHCVADRGRCDLSRSYRNWEWQPSPLSKRRQNVCRERRGSYAS